MTDLLLRISVNELYDQYNLHAGTNLCCTYTSFPFRTTQVISQISVRTSVRVLGLSTEAIKAEILLKLVF